MEAKLIGKSLATEDDHPHIPDEVIFENIMTRVTVSTLMRCSSICKHWYKSILDDPHFSTAYLAHQSSKKDFPFVLYMLNVPKDKDSSTIFCGGALFWRTKSFSSDNDVLLLSFNLHDYEFQVIRLPAECASSSLLEQEHQIIDPLLEFKGSPCVARLEKTKLGGESCSTSTTSDDQNTSYCYKVHLHILKEYSKVGRPNEQVWIKETFDVAPLSLLPTLLSPAAPCFVRDGSADTNRAPPNRIMTSSDGRVFLYCFCGQIVQTYDLQTKRLKIANCNMYASIFFKKKHSKVYDQIDYHLNGGHIENFMSMLAFIPKGGGAPPRLDLDEFSSIMNDKQRKLHVVGYLSVGHQKSADLYLI